MKNFLTAGLVFLCVLMGGCASPLKPQFNDLTFKKVSDEEMKALYENKALARIAFWTDGDFISSSKLSRADLISNRDVSIEANGKREVIGYFAAKTYIVAYVPAGKVIIKTNAHSKLEQRFEVNLIAGAEQYYFWAAPEKNLVSSARPGYTNTTATISPFSAGDWIKELSPKIRVAKEIIKESKVDFIVEIDSQFPISNFKLNDESINLKDGKATISRPLKFGKNGFAFEAKNEMGFTGFYNDSYYRVSPEERQAEIRRATKKELDEKQRIIELEKTRKIEAERVAKNGDGSEDDRACQSYGLKPSTAGYSECRMRLDLDRKQAQRNQELKQQELTQRQREQAAQERAFAAEQNHRSTIQSLQLLQGIQQQQQQQQLQFQQQLRVPIQTNCYRNGQYVNCTTQ